MNDFTKYSIEADARRFCHRHEITDPESYQNIVAHFTHKYFLQHIEPFVKLKGRVLAFSLPTITVVGGVVEYKYSDETMAKIANIDTAINDIAERYGYKNSAIVG